MTDTTMPRRVWITGASSGLGLALAGEYARRGWTLLASGRNRAALEDLERDLGAQAYVFDYEDRPALIGAATWAADRRPDLVILNAGMSQRMLARDTEAEQARRLLAVDLEAPMILTLELLRRLGPSPERPLRIAAVSSLAGLVPAPLRACYSAAKHGLAGFFKTLRVEEAGRGLEVTLVYPGFVRTAIADRALRPEGADGAGSAGRADDDIRTGMDPARAARLIASGLEAGKRTIYPGYDASARMALVLSRFAPGILDRALGKRFLREWPRKDP